jgi:hypothetical protein
MIPEEMKIWCQDDWLLVTNRNSNKQNYKLSNFKVDGYVSLTNDSLDDNEIKSIRENDLLLKQYYNLF